MNKCLNGWNDGSCCCNCQHQLKLMCHPWNGADNLDKIKFGKGAVSEQCGWVCVVSLAMSEENWVQFFDFEHGICELHTPRLNSEQALQDHQPTKA